MGKRKNLTADDHEAVDVWEANSQNVQQLKNTIDITNIPIKVKCLNQKQKSLKKAIENSELTIAIGPAGTGKTYLSLLTALHLLKTTPKYRKIVLIKSVQTIKGEDLGFLPGTLKEKMEPYMQSFIGNLNKIFGDRFTSKKMMESDYIGIEPIAFVRGNTIDNSIVIIDETQNIDMHTFKTIITRIGKNSKMIFLGDVEQVDKKGNSCLESAFNGFNDSDFVSTIQFEQEECVRNPIIPKVLKVLDSL